MKIMTPYSRWAKTLAMLVVASASLVVIAEWSLNKHWMAADVLRGAGFTEIELGGYAWADCTWIAEPFATRFKAKSEEGRLVTGAVCSGWLLGANVAMDRQAEEHSLGHGR